MPTFKETVQELAQKAGISETKAKGILEAFDDQDLAKLFTENFVPRSTFSSELDKVRDSEKKRADEATAKAAQYQEWYDKQAKPAYEANVANLQRLQKYVETYGELPTGEQVRTAMQQNGVTREELEKILTDKMAEQNVNYSRLLKFLPQATLQYRENFGEVPNLGEFEEFAGKSNLPLEAAWDKWTSPKLEEKRNKEVEAKIQAAREEGMRDGASRARNPVGGSRREGGNFLDRITAPDKKPENEQAKAGRNAFLETMNDPNWKELATK